MKNWKWFSPLILMAFLFSCNKEDMNTDNNNNGGPIGGTDTVYSNVLNIIDDAETVIECEGYLTPEFCKFATDKTNGAWIVQVQRPDRVPFVTRVKNDHSIDWIKSLGVTNTTPLGMIAAADGVIIVLRSSLLRKTILVKLDQSGNKLWEKSSDLFVQSFNAEKVILTEKANGNILYAGETKLVEFDTEGNVANSYEMTKSIDATIEYQGFYYCFSRNSSGVNYDVFKLDQSLNLDTSITIEVVNQTQNLKGVHISQGGQIIAFFNVDRGQAGMHNRIYYLDEDLVGLQVKKGVLSKDGLDYMFTELHTGSYELPTGEYGFGIFRSRGNLGNQDLGYHMIAFGNSVQYGVPYNQTPLFGIGGLYNDGKREHTGIFTLSTTSVLLSYPVSNLGDCAGGVTYKLSNLTNDDFVYSGPQISYSAGNITTTSSSEIQLKDYTTKENGSSFCIR